MNLRKFVAVFVSAGSASACVMADGPASSAAAAGPAGMGMFLPLIAIMGLFYFLLIRPQQKQAKEQERMVDSLKRGDRILTQGGFYATIHAVKGKVLEVKLNDEVKVLLNRSAVSQLITGDPAQEPEEPTVVPAKK